MQLIELIEPSAIDIKNNMSTLEETIAIENNQINGVFADIGNDVAKIPHTKNDTTSSTVENTNGDSPIKEQLENQLKDLNGIVKSNGDAQTLSVDDYKNESVVNVIDNKSAANGQSNGDSLSSESCESTYNILVHIDTTAEANTILENSSNDLSKNVDSTEKEELTIDRNNADVLLNEKEIPDMISVENLPAVVDKQATVSIEEVSVANKLKSIEISIENETMPLNVSDFSPNFDTNEEVNISAQLQQLENDVSIEDDDIKILTEDSNTLPLPNDKLATPVLNKKNEILTKPAEKNDTIESSEVCIKISPVEDKRIDTNIISEMDLKVSSSVEKPDNSLDISLEVTPPIGKNTEDESLMDVVKENINKTITEISETKEVPEVAIINQSTGGTSDNNMDVDTSKCKPMDGQEVEYSKSDDGGVEKKPPVHRYVTVKNITDMVYPSAPITTTENIKTSDIPDCELAQIDKNQQGEGMDVDATPENIISFDTCNKHHLDQKTNVEMTNTIIIENKTVDESSGASKENLVMAIEQQEIDNSGMEIDGSIVMEINDNVAVPVAEQSASDNVAKVDTENTSSDVKICDETKQNAVIDIIDNDDEDITVKDSDTSNVISIDDSVKDTLSEDSQKHSTVVETVNEVDERVVKETSKQNNENLPESTPKKQLPVVCKLSNTMDILSDDEDDLSSAKPNEDDKTCENLTKVEEQNKCINLDDDDDIMFIEDTNSQDAISKEVNTPDQQSDKTNSQAIKTSNGKINTDDNAENEVNLTKIHEDELPKVCEKDSPTPIEVDSQPEVIEPKPVEATETQKVKPIITKSFLKSVTKNLADMTRNELEDFCILKLVESVVDKSNLNEIKNKMKTMAQAVEDLRKKALALTKQNRDLQVVVKTVQEDHKKRNTNPMMPMKITRSVGMQVVLSTGEKSILKKKLSTPSLPPPIVPTRPAKNMQNPKIQKPVANNIPVPRLVPASSPTVKSPATPVNNTKPTATPARNTTPQRPEKRPHNKLSPASSVTVDLTDDEPPAKINTKNSTPPVRLVPSQSLMPPKNKPQFVQAGNSPRKVYIPISSSNQNVRPQQPSPSVMKNFVPPTPRPRQSSVVRMQTLRVNQLPTSSRHPAPLPDAMKQYQPPTWKALPPAPDLKLSKVDNGIVISWKFEGCQPDAYEEVASFQLYAYQETPAPPSTALWKKIGDIKALPLPMACTLTQFMSGFKYYFAVRAIDVRSRIGPFSLPGSIMLISKS